MRLRVTTGEEWPGGSAVFQITFLLGPNSTGRPLVTETPLPFGPRNCDQSSATAFFIGLRAATEGFVNPGDDINSAIDEAKIVLITVDIILRKWRFVLITMPVLRRANNAE